MFFLRILLYSLKVAADSRGAMFDRTGNQSMLVDLSMPDIILIAWFTCLSTNDVWWLAAQTEAYYSAFE